MTIEELKSMKLIVDNYYTEFDVGMNAYVTRSVGIKLLKLIDEEIARQSIADENVRKAIDILDDFDKENFDDRSVGIFEDKDMKFAVPLAITALEQMQGWISVKDRFPETYGKFIVFMPPFEERDCIYDGGIQCGFYSEECGFITPDCFPEGGVSHWMPLPKPPKGENNG